MGPRTWSYAVNDFEDRKELATPLQDGWDITSDGSHLVVGDSTDKLTWVDAASMQSVRQVAVKGEGEAALQARGRGEEAGRRIGQGRAASGAGLRLAGMGVGVSSGWVCRGLRRHCSRRRPSLKKPLCPQLCAAPAVGPCPCCRQRQAGGLAERAGIH
jgi:hypothetical protein